MTDPEVVIDDIEAIIGDDAQGGRKRRSKRTLLLLLLLLLCGITSILDVWVAREPNRARFVTRNLECLQCHTELIPDFSKSAVHNPFMLKQCTVCHTPHGKEVERTTLAGASRTWKRARTLIEWLPLKWIISAYDSVAGVTDTDSGGEVIGKQTEQLKDSESHLVAPETELCWICHGDLGPKLSMSYQHAPFSGGFCTDCHDPHASDFRALLNQDERDLCVTCHPIGPELARKQVHPPVEGRFCTNCHDPHASDWRGILVARQRELCFRCHPTVALLSLKAVQHNPFLYDNCTGCHEPHGSDYIPLLIANQPGLCYMCHPGIRNDFLKKSHHPVDTLKLNCADCHNPHAADYKALLIAEDNKLCYVCHAVAIKATYEKSAHVDTLCIECHTPHGSEFAPILQEPHPELCFNCHPWARNKNNHPYRPDLYYDTYARKRMTCVSTCHDPHGTLYPKMIQLPYGVKGYGHDNLCLACHKGVGKTF
ncbi:MAG: cytochrome c3 family protein [Actinomycetota bacterium]|nr:cytochrome c3 family protein [Actinomycetota bacterium]